MLMKLSHLFLSSWFAQVNSFTCTPSSILNVFIQANNHETKNKIMIFSSSVLIERIKQSQLLLEINAYDNMKDDDEQNSFYQDLQKAKSDKLGADMYSSSSQQMQESVKQSESDFLSAMKQVKQEFKQSKDEYGVDVAIDLLRQGWDLEDRLWELELEKEDIMFEEEEKDDDENNNDNDENDSSYRSNDEDFSSDTSNKFQ